MSADNRLVEQIKTSSLGPSVLQCAVLGAWENLCGPCVKCRFTPTEECYLSLEEARSLVKIALSYHLKDPPEHNYFNICDYGDRGLSGLNCVYTALVNKEEVNFCFLCVFPRDYFQRLKSLTSILSAFWQEEMNFMKVHHYLLGSMTDEIFHNLSTVVSAFVDLLSQIEINCQSVSRLPVTGMWPMDFKKSFVQRCISSHLITFGRSLVIGTNTSTINHMIHVLTLFSLPHRQDLCVFLNRDGQRQYHSELYVQGLLWRSSEDRKYPISLWELLKGDYPLTIINVNKDEVHRSVSLLHHKKRRKAYMANGISTFIDKYSTRSDKSNFSIFQFAEDLVVDDLMSDGNIVSEEVTKLCIDLTTISNNIHQIVTAVNLFMRQMATKAKFLIAYVHNLPKKSDGAPLLSRRTLWTALNIGMEGDYLILETIAEQLQPGIIDVLDRITDESSA